MIWKKNTKNTENLFEKTGKKRTLIHCLKIKIQKLVNSPGKKLNRSKHLFDEILFLSFEIQVWATDDWVLVCMTVRHNVLFSTDTDDQLSALKEFSFYTFSWWTSATVLVEQQKQQRCTRNTLIALGWLPVKYTFIVVLFRISMDEKRIPNVLVFNADYVYVRVYASAHECVTVFA